jgi:hypothetical protein
MVFAEERPFRGLCDLHLGAYVYVNEFMLVSMCVYICMYVHISNMYVCMYFSDGFVRAAA